MMNCHAIEPLLSAWVDGQLAEAQAEKVRDHLAQCPSCWEEFQALEQLGQQMAALKAMRVGPAPEGLLAGVHALPGWLVGLAVVRRWLLPTSCLIALAVGGLWLLSWSDPLRGTLLTHGTQATQSLTAGTTLAAPAGETATLALAGGTIALQGPGSLIVHQAETGRLRNDERITLELPKGQAIVRFEPNAPVHRVWLITPHAQLHLTGTWVQLSANSEATQVRVFEGTAQLTNLTTHESVSLTAGVMADVQAAKTIVHPIPMEEWLSHTGITGPTLPEAEPASPSDQSTDAPSPLWYEEK